MTHSTRINLLILWEQEIRKAAAMLVHARESLNDDSLDADTKYERVFQAFTAAGIALDGAENPDACIMFSAQTVHGALALGGEG